MNVVRPSSRLEVEDDAALVAIEREEGRIAVAGRLHGGAAHAAGEIAREGWLDLDHVCTEVAKLHGAERAGHDLREVEDANPVEGGGHGANSRSSLSRRLG